MKTLHLAAALFAVVLGLSALSSSDAAPLNISLPCGTGDNVVYFSLTADRISASMGATDADAWEVDQVLWPDSTCSAVGSVLTADLRFNTTQANVTLSLKAIFTVAAPGGPMPGGAWNCTSLTAQVNSNQKMTPTAIVWVLPVGQLQAVDWLNSANRTLGKRCSHGEVVLNTKNKLGIDNFRLLPGTTSEQPETNDDNYALCAADMSSGGLGGLAWWVWVLIIVGVLIVLGGVGFGGYTIYQRQHHH
jgi:hypothetical protein